MLPDTTSKGPPTFFYPNRALEGKKEKKKRKRKKKLYLLLLEGSFQVTQWMNEGIMAFNVMLKKRLITLQHGILSYSHTYFSWQRPCDHFLWSFSIATKKKKQLCELFVCRQASKQASKAHFRQGSRVQFPRNQFGLIWSKLNPWVGL